MSDTNYQLLPITNDHITTHDLRPRKKNRLYWADCARIFSMFNIVFLHCSNYYYEKTLRNSDNPNWKIVCIYNSLTRFSVPIHNILRLFTAFYFWSGVNAFLNIYNNKNISFFTKEGNKKFLEYFLVGEEYLWFILMIVGCYIVVPFLRLFSDNVVLARYFIGLFIIWSSLIPTFKNILRARGYNDALRNFNVWTNRWHYYFTIEFVGYFVTGYHLLKYVNIKSQITRCIIYLICIVDVIFYISLTLSVEDKEKGYSEHFRNNFSFFVLLYSIILFLFFKYEIGKINFSHKTSKIITKLSSLTFGIYLCHLIVRNMLDKININQHAFLGIEIGPAVGIPILFTIVSSISLLISYMISFIPILNRYIV